MSELFLIAHRCRGEPTFDVAERMICPSCDVGESKVKDDYCEECNDEGYWWILSTSGYRAHPWEYHLLSTIQFYGNNSMQRMLNDMPLNALDCFPINSPSHKPSSDRSNDLLARLNLIPKGPSLRRLR